MKVRQHMPRAKSKVKTVKTDSVMTGKEVLYKVLTLKADYGQDTDGLESDAEYIELLTMMRANKKQSKVFDGIRYTVGGQDAGRNNPSKGLDVLIKSIRGEMRTPKGKVVKAPTGWAKLTFSSPESGNCPDCNSPLGLDVRYTKEDGTGKSPSLSISHAIPRLFFGATNDTNCTVECRKCNGRRADRMPKKVREWYESLVFTVYTAK
jgi:5-methylcytosine-specific restriction endonuclease McrA